MILEGIETEPAADIFGGDEIKLDGTAHVILREDGILAVLDSRLLRKQYGRRFLESLPPARLVHDLDAVARFMA